MCVSYQTFYHILFVNHCEYCDNYTGTMSFASKCNYLEKLFMQIQFLTACPWCFDHPGHQPHPGQDFLAWAHPQILQTVPLIVQPYCAVQRMPLCTWQHDMVDTAAQSADLWNLRFIIPNASSTTERVDVWLSWYRLSCSVPGSSNGVMNQVRRGYALSPST